MKKQPTPGNWDFACDSYGKVQHSNMACVFTLVASDDGDRLVTVAHRIDNWEDAKLMAAAPDLLAACEQFIRYADNGKQPHLTRYAKTIAGRKMRDAISKAKGQPKGQP